MYLQQKNVILSETKESQTLNIWSEWVISQNISINTYRFLKMICQDEGIFGDGE